MLLQVDRHQTVELGGGERRLAWREQRDVNGLLGVQIGDDAARKCKRVMIVLRQVIDAAGLARMEIAAAEIFGADYLADRGFDQLRPAEKNRALPLDDDGLVAHRRHVSAAGSV